MVHYLLDSSVRRKRGARMRRSHRTAASGKTRGVDVVPICSSSDQAGLGSDSDDVEEVEDDDGEEEEEQDDSDDEDYIDTDCDGVLEEEDEKAPSRLFEEDDEENALETKPNDEERCRKVVDLLRWKQSLDTLKLGECKSYLRSHGLRLSGTKSTCVSRILEHWRLKDGNGEILYPWSSFFINCTGDVCKGDVVRFRQRVYDKFTRRTIIGKRTIAGRVVKESYGAAKQQHTFTVEVLWSRGKNALPPMFPLLVKGRNLYRLKTFRQPWSNEQERSKVLAEKHQRGAVARHIRKNSKAMSMNGGSRHHQGSSFDAKLNGKKRRGEQSRDISGRKKKKVAASSRKVPCENTSSQAHTDTVARNFDPSYDVPRQAVNNGGSRPYKGISSDANKQANWTRNASLHNVPHASTSRSANLNVQDAMTRSFHPSYNNRRQGINHGGSTYGQHPVSLRNAFYDHNTRLELLHPTAAPPPTNPGIAYAPTHRRDGSFAMTRASHLPSNMRYQFNHPYASVASSVDPWTESQHWQRP
ncbi:zinc finger CCCH domain-containing protein 62-like isoform X1 [Zingiber officinale]|uniref:zinc finger CCCH domain-containing protein 62-like isoform X1 n=1 Tax=Zingiber officinale TaxID=94328 RepID=UPI001C4BD92C|nr:zinc finger CCCH domain-containing protein 62-like isoform X1 [Zingiber officinale]